MKKLVIVESNTPDMVKADRAAGRLPAAEGYAEVMAALGDVQSTILAPYAGEAAELEGADGVIFTGSGVAWDTADRRAKPLAQVMEQVFAQGLPCYGSCNGMQLAAVVLGGAVAASTNGREDGLARDVQLTEAGAAHAMLAGRKSGFTVPCIHRDEVSVLPKEAVLLASNAHSPVQAFAYEQGGVRFWGSQYHPELTVGSITEILERVGLADAAEREALRQENLPELAPQTRMTELRNWLAALGTV